MTLIQLRYLVAIVDAGFNITDAAQVVNATQPGLSKQLKLLEDELGFQIFARHGKKLGALSTAGLQIVDSARLILTEAANIRSHATNGRGDVDGDLRILTTQTQAQYVLPSALSRLRDVFPQVRVHLDLSTAPAIRRSEQADFDVAFVSAVDQPPADAFAFPLYRWRWVALAPSDHPLARTSGSVTLRELSRHPLIGYQSAQQNTSSIAQAFAQAGHPIRFAYAAQNSEVIKTYVRTGLGIGLVAEMALGDLPPDLTAIAVDDGLPTCTAWALLPRDRILRDYVLEFLTLLAPHFSQRDIRRVVQFSGELGVTAIPAWEAHPIQLQRENRQSAKSDAASLKLASAR